MRIEAFSEAKNPAAPEANEDALLILPGRAYAVIDGVSDRTGVRYDGMLAGQFASTLVRRRLEGMLGGARRWTMREIVADLTAAIDAAYGRFGIRDQVTTDWGGKIATTLALAVLDGDRVEVVLVGDSGVRINGAELVREEKDLDRITSLLRREAWRAVKARTDDPLIWEKVSRQVAFHGAGQDAAAVAPWLDADALARVGAAARAACAADLPHVPADAVAGLVARGIVGGQGGHQNNAASPLGYSCLDGFAIPEHFIRFLSWPRAEVATIELFTDGYFRPGDGFGVDAWEAAFRQAEAEDAAKVELYLSPRGSAGGLWADDRSYLGIRL